MPLHLSLLHFYFSSNCFKHVFFMFAFASCVSAIQSRGFGRADFTPIPGSIQQAGGGAGLSLVVSTHVFLGAVQKENIFQRLLAPRPPVLLLLWLFQKKMNSSISKEQSFRINIKNAGLNVIKSLKLSQNRGFGLVWWVFLSHLCRKVKKSFAESGGGGGICIPRSRELQEAHPRRGVSPAWQTAVQPRSPAQPLDCSLPRAALGLAAPRGRERPARSPGRSKAGGRAGRRVL